MSADNEFGSKVYAIGSAAYRLKNLSIADEELIKPIVGSFTIQNTTIQPDKEFNKSELDILLPIILIRIDGQPITEGNRPFVKDAAEDDIAHLIMSFFLQKLQKQKNINEYSDNFARLIGQTKKKTKRPRD